MKKNIFFLFLFFKISCYSQEKDKPIITNVSKVTFFGMGYEKSIGKNQSLNFRVFMNVSGSVGYSSSLGNTSEFYYDPAIAIQYRYYYNLGKRLAKNKRTEMNSANYISSAFQTVFSKRRITSSYYVEGKARPIYKAGIAWGMQRNYKGRFSLDGSMGPGYLFTKGSLPNSSGETIKKNVNQFTLIGQFSLGFWLNRRK